MMAENSIASSGSLEEDAPTTPPNECPDLPAHSTPTVHKRSHNIPYTSNHTTREDTLTALGHEMVGYVVGPMPIKKFLEFLPRSPEKKKRFRSSLFAKFAKQTRETKMYAPFINAMARFCPDLQGIDTSATFMKEFSGDIIKPDITYYNSPLSDGENLDIESAELIVEVKLDVQDDPFKVKPDDQGLLGNTDRPRQTLGQMTRYATAHLAAQFRTHVFSILVFPKWARLMRWDRAGVVVSERISLNQSHLAEFFWRFNHADAQDRGHDPTVTPFKFTKDLTKQFFFEELQFTADPGDVKVEDIKFFEVLLPREDRRYVIGKATYLGVSSLASRATRSFKAWCLKTKKAVFLKDTWRILSDSQRPEHEIYEKLAAAKVQHIATMLDHSDIEGHRTQTGDYANKTWVCKVELKPIRTLQHYRLVLREIGRSLTLFTDFREVLAAMCDALQAHRESYYEGRVLHRDISAGNIIIYERGGLLIDWDMSKDLDLIVNEKSISRTGTWAFQSLRLSRRQKMDDLPIVQNRLDDLESFYHVLFWISLQHARHELDSAELYDELTRLFDHALFVDDQPYSNPTKDSHMTSARTIERAKFQNPPLLELLLDISVNFRPLYVTPSASNKKLTKSQINKAQPVEESYQKALEIHKEDLNFLNSKENSHWMEDSFQKALEHPIDEWGRTDYVLNEKALPVIDRKAKRLYSDMRVSNLRYSQAGTFPPDHNAEVDVNEDADDAEEDAEVSEEVSEDSEEDAEDSEGDESEEDSEEDDQPPRTRRRLD